MRLLAAWLAIASAFVLSAPTLAQDRDAFRKDLAEAKYKATELHALKNLEGARAVVNALVSQALGAFGADDIAYADALIVRGDTLLMLGERNEAVPDYTAAHSIYDKRLPETAEQTIDVLDKLAALDAMSDPRSKKFVEPRIALWQRVIEHSRSSSPPDLRIVGTLQEKLSDLLMQQGRYAEALSVTRQILATQEAQHGPTSPQLLGALSKLIVLLEDDRATLAEAEQVHKRMLALIESPAGDKRLLMAKLEEMARFYGAKVKSPQQERVYLERLLSIEESNPSKTRINIANRLEALARNALKQGLWSDLETYCLRGLEIREAVPGATRRALDPSLSFLLQLYRSTGRADEAKQLEERIAKKFPT